MVQSLLPVTVLCGFLGACLLNFTGTRKGMKAWREPRDPFAVRPCSAEAVA